MNLPRLTCKLLLTSIVAAAGLAAAAEPAKLPGVNELLPSPSLPDPFVFPDGTRCKTRADWAKRRTQIIEQILYYEYGHLPPAPGNVHGEAKNTIQLPGGASERTVTLTMGEGGKIAADITITSPAGAGPFPVIVKGDLCWKRVKPEIVNAVITRGYVLVEFDRTVFAPDKAGREAGLLSAYPTADEGCLAAWAWGFSRVIDYLQTQDWADKAKVIVTGHSRGGKAALLAGALDERVALTVPNGSGAGGAGCYRVAPGKAETLDMIYQHFPYWFGPNFSQFVGHPDQLPFDQHFVRALVAPRALLNTDALADEHANGPGTQETYLAAWEVYKFLNAPEKIGISWREGKHEHNAEDFSALLDFADYVLLGKAPARDFNKLPFPNEPKAFGWITPAVAKN